MPPTELLRANETSDMGQSAMGQDTEETGLGGSAGVAAEEIVAREDGTATKPGGKATKEAEGAYMAFDRGPVSVEAKALVDELIEMIKAREQTEGTRKRARRQQVQEDLVKLVGQFAGELVAAVDRDALPLLPCSKNANDLAERGIGHPVFKAVFNGLEGMELIKTEVRGSWSRWASAEDELAGVDLADAFVGDASLIVRTRGRATRIRPTQAFLELVRRQGIKPYTASRHFPRLSPPAPLQLREGSRWVYGDKLPQPRASPEMPPRSCPRGCTGP